MLTRTSRKSTAGFSMDHILITRIVIIAAFFAALFLADGMSRNYATLTLQVGEERRTFEGEIVPGMSVLDALNASATAGQIPLEFSVDETNRTRILSIASRTSVQADGVIFFINGQEVAGGDIHRISVNPGDRIEVRIP